jgi:hypothetical protein
MRTRARAPRPVGRCDRAATCLAIEASDTHLVAGFPDSNAFAVDSDQRSQSPDATAAGPRCPAEIAGSMITAAACSTFAGPD